MKNILLTISVGILVCHLSYLSAQFDLDISGDAIIRDGTPQLSFWDSADNRQEGLIYESADHIYHRSYFGDMIFTANSATVSNDLRIDHNTGRIGLSGLPSSGARLTIHEDAQAIRLDGNFSSIGWYNGSTAKAEAFVDNSNRMTIGTIPSSSLRFKTNNTTRMTVASSGSILTGNSGSLNGALGALLLCDSDPLSQGVTISGADDQFVARFRNGYYFMTSGNNPRTGIVAGPGANAWSSISDVHLKENFEYLNDIENFKKLASVKYSSWNYIGQNPETYRHYGIMAQEFFKLFGKDSYGTIGSDNLVNPIDMIGVTMSGLKGASLIIDKQNEQLSDQKLKIEALEKNYSALLDEIQQLKIKIIGN